MRLRRLSARQTTIARAVLGIAFLTLGVVILVTGDRLWIGIVYLLIGIVWGMLAFLGWWKPQRVFRSP
jgi:hypothetical protein